MPRLYPVLFALCVPLVFLHADYQPSFTVSVGGSDATLFLSDVAVLAVGAVGLVAGCRLGFAPLRAGRAIWIASAVFLAFVLAGTAVGAASTDGYPLADNLLTAAKFAEYALLALAAPLAVRGAQELMPLLVVAHRMEHRGDVRSAPAVPRRPERVRGPSAGAARAVVPRDPRPRGALRRDARHRAARARARASGGGSGSSPGSRAGSA